MRLDIATAVGALMLAAACMERVPDALPPALPPASRQTHTQAESRKSPVPRPLPPGCAPATTLIPDARSPFPYPIWREPAPSPFEEPTTYAELVEPLVGNYTPLAKEAGVGGLVILEVVVSSKGVPLGARVLKGLPCGLEAEAKKAVRNAKFRPARRGDRAIDSLLNVSVQFRPPTRK